MKLCLVSQVKLIFLSFELLSWSLIPCSCIRHIPLVGVYMAYLPHWTIRFGGRELYLFLRPHSPLDITVKKNFRLLDESVYHLGSDQTQILLKPILLNNLLSVLCISMLPVNYWGWIKIVYLNDMYKGHGICVFR